MTKFQRVICERVFGGRLDTSYQEPPDFQDSFEYLFSKFDDREQGILIHRFKFGETFRQIGDIYGVTKSRANQIVEGCLRKLRCKCNREILLYGLSKYNLIQQERREKENPSVNDMDLSLRAYNCLMRSRIENKCDILSFIHSTGVNDPVAALKKVRNLGERGAKEVVEKFHISQSF